MKLIRKQTDARRAIIEAIVRKQLSQRQEEEEINRSKRLENDRHIMNPKRYRHEQYGYSLIRPRSMKLLRTIAAQRAKLCRASAVITSQESNKSECVHFNTIDAARTLSSLFSS